MSLSSLYRDLNTEEWKNINTVLAEYKSKASTESEISEIIQLFETLKEDPEKFFSYFEENIALMHKCIFTKYDINSLSNIIIDASAKTISDFVRFIESRYGHISNIRDFLSDEASSLSTLLSLISIEVQRNQRGMKRYALLRLKESLEIAVSVLTPVAT